MSKQLLSQEVHAKTSIADLCLQHTAQTISFLTMSCSEDTLHQNWLTQHDIAPVKASSCCHEMCAVRHALLACARNKQHTALTIYHMQCRGVGPYPNWLIEHQTVTELNSQTRHHLEAPAMIRHSVKKLQCLQ